MNNLEVSIVKYLCPVCGKEAEEAGKEIGLW